MGWTPVSVPTASPRHTHALPASWIGPGRGNEPARMNQRREIWTALPGDRDARMRARLPSRSCSRCSPGTHCDQPPRPGHPHHGAECPFAETQAGAIPYVNPDPANTRCWAGSSAGWWARSSRPDDPAPDHRRSRRVHDGGGPGSNAALFYRLARADRAAPGAGGHAGPGPEPLPPSRPRPCATELDRARYVLLGYLAHRRRRCGTAAALWSIGCGLKRVPGAFFHRGPEMAALFAVERRPVAPGLGAGAVFAAVTAALNLPFALPCLRETGSLASSTARALRLPRQAGPL